MLINELAKEIHQNAVDHGWWDEERDTPEIVALIHSEWSEALEEARAGNPMVYACLPEGGPMWTPRTTENREEIMNQHLKPEGIAVELIDGCIRVLDYMGHVEAEVTTPDGGKCAIEDFYIDDMLTDIPDKITEVIACLHVFTSQMLMQDSIPDGHATLMIFAMALGWVKKQGIDPLALMLEKHEYNKTRPYKHGKRF